MLFFFFFFLSFIFPTRNFLQEISRVWKCAQGDLIREAGVKALSVLFKFSILRKNKKRKILFTVIFRWEYNNARIAVQINLIIRSNSIGDEVWLSARYNSSCRIFRNKNFLQLLYLHKLPSLDSTFFPLCKFIQFFLWTKQIILG